MKAIWMAVLIGVGVVACSPEERRDVTEDAGQRLEAPSHPDGSLNKDADGNPVFDGQPDYDPAEVAAWAMQKALEKTQKEGPVGALAWLASNGVAIAVGWFGRKYLDKKYASPRPVPLVPDGKSSASARAK